MALARTVNLFGGPYHGQQIAVPTGYDHVHIKGLDERGVIDAGAAAGGIEKMPTRTGTYSQVSGPGNQNNFEWDGWTNE